MRRGRSRCSFCRALIRAITADVLEDRCYPRSGTKNKLHQTVKRLRKKIDCVVDQDEVGESVVRTPHRGARTTYELHGLVIDLTT